MMDLSSLSDLMDGILESTENVRWNIQRECDEASFVLRPWVIDTLVTRQVEPGQCTCPQVKSLDDQAEEIALSIDKALQQSHELRKVLARQMKQEEKKLSRPTVQQIYQPKLNIKPKIQESAVKNGKIQHQDSKQLLKSDKKKDEPLKLPKIKSKNFIAANKSSIKLMSQKNSKTKIESKSSSASSDGSLKSKNRFPSVTELDSLIKKVTFETTKNSSSPCLNNFNYDCPQHGDNITRIVTEKKKITIDIVEGLDRFGVPGDLLKILKLYQSFVTKIEKEKSRKKVNGFLDDLETFHEQQISETSEKDLVYLVNGFNKLHRDLHGLSLDKSKLISLRDSYSELDNLSKICNIKKYDTLKTRRSNIQESEYLVATGWLSNGFWNNSCIKYFPELLKLNSIDYSNKNQLLLFFDLSQRLQHVIYQKKLIDIIIDKIIPNINIFDNDSKEYINLYKMIFTIVQVLNPNLPVLVKIE